VYGYRDKIGNYGYRDTIANRYSGVWIEGNHRE